MLDRLSPPRRISLLWDPQYEDEHERYLTALAERGDEARASAARPKPEMVPAALPARPRRPQSAQSLLLDGGRVDAELDLDRLSFFRGDARSLLRGNAQSPKSDRATGPSLLRFEEDHPYSVAENRARAAAQGPAPPRYHTANAALLTPAGVDAGASSRQLILDLEAGQHWTGLTVVDEDRTSVGSIIRGVRSAPFDIKVTIEVKARGLSYTRNDRLTQTIPAGGFISVPLQGLGPIEGPARVTFDVQNVGPYHTGIIVGANPDHGEPGRAR